MGLFRRIAAVLGFLREGHDGAADGAEADVEEEVDRAAKDAALNRKGFSVQVPVAVDRPTPVVVPCSLADGGVQGFRWYAWRLRIDSDGDVADEFLEEIPPVDAATPLPKFEVKYRTRPAAARKQIVSSDGNLLHSVEHLGRLQWV